MRICLILVKFFLFHLLGISWFKWSDISTSISNAIQQQTHLVSPDVGTFAQHQSDDTNVVRQNSQCE